MKAQNKVQLDGKILRQALIDIDQARLQVTRLKGYKRLTAGMKDDLSRWSRREREARVIIDTFIAGDYEVVEAKQSNNEANE